jgi:cell division protein FtsW
MSVITEISNNKTSWITRWKNSIGNYIGGDKVIWALVIFLMLVSIPAIYSATKSLAYRTLGGNTEKLLFDQLKFIFGGILIIYFAHRIDYKIYSKFAKPFFLFSVFLLIYVLFFGEVENDASRWIKIPFLHIKFQPSDPAKLALILYLARLLSRKQSVIKNFKEGFLPLVYPILIICILIGFENFSTASLLAASCAILLFLGRVKMKHLMLLVGIGVILFAILIGAALMEKDNPDRSFDTSNVEKKKDTVNNNAEANKINSFFFRMKTRKQTIINRVKAKISNYKESDSTKHVQPVLAQIAILKGGIFGVGPGNSITRNSFPEVYNDFIFAIIIEEYGLAGGTFLLFIYLAFLYRCIRLFKRCPFAFGSFLVIGLSFTLLIQVIANMIVAVDLFLPVTGVTLPLVSKGGTSFLVTCLAIGMILSVSRTVENIQRKPQPALVSAVEENKKEEENE